LRLTVGGYTKFFKKIRYDKAKTGSKQK